MIYEPNDKHKPVPTPGRRGSICPADVDSDDLLQGSDLAPAGGKRFNTDGKRAYLCAAPRLGTGRLAWLPRGFHRGSTFHPETLARLGPS